MATLTIDGTEYEVVGGVGWSTETLRKTPLPGGGYRANYVPCYIEAAIDISRARSSDANRADVTVRLSLDDGTEFEGHNLVNTASGETNGSVLFVRYEGSLVTQIA